MPEPSTNKDCLDGIKKINEKYDDLYNNFIKKQPSDHDTITPITIPPQLIAAGSRFVLVGKRSKAAIEQEWEINNYDATSKVLLDHIVSGGNYGVITRNGICMLDIDNPSEFSTYNAGLPKSFTVVRGNGRSGHYYFKCPDCPEEMRKKIELSWGDIRLGGNFYTVGPGCVAPIKENPSIFLTYDIANADPIQEVPWLKIEALINSSKKTTSVELIHNTPFAMPPGKVDQRHPVLKQIVGSMVAKGFAFKSILAACIEENKITFNPPKPQDVLEKEILSLYEYTIKKQQLKKEQPKPTKTSYTGISLDDCGNAIRMCNQHGKNIRHCEEWGKWFIWDGQRWKEDKDNTIYYLAKKVAKSIYSEASMCNDGKQSVEIAKFAHESSNNSRINAMVESTKSEHDYNIPIRFEILDQDLYLLNLSNGTLDLRSGELYPHDQINMITKISPVAFSPSATCPTWLKFLDRIFKGQSEKNELISFLKRSCGYSMTGNTSEQVMFFLYGSGANGKSTFIDVIQYILGDYAAATESATFTTARGDAIRNDIARLVGMRFVSASENSTESLLDEALVKKLTGGEKISARFLHKEYFEFYPEFKIWWAFNHQPYIRDNTNSIWRRILLIPFEEIIPESEQDKDLARKLHSEAPGILNWMIEGLKEYNVIGLLPPEKVMTTTKEYREDQDILHDFLNECCKVSDNQSITLTGDMVIQASVLYSRYSEWFRINGGSPKELLSSTKFGKLLLERGFQRTRDSKGKWYHGIKLKS